MPSVAPPSTVSSSDAGQNSGGVPLPAVTSGYWRHYFQTRQGPLFGNRPNWFQGCCDELKVQVYNCLDACQSDQHTRTTQEIVELIGRTYKFGMDTRLSLENLKLATIPQPEDPPDNATKTETQIWEKSVGDFVKQRTTLNKNIKTAYPLIWGQCSDIM
jgi:hypothetical protein